MKYLTLDLIENGCVKHKDWVIDAIMTSRFSQIIKYIVEEEQEYFFNNQTECSKRKDHCSNCKNILIQDDGALWCKSCDWRGWIYK